MGGESAVSPRRHVSDLYVHVEVDVKQLPPTRLACASTDRAEVLPTTVVLTAHRSFQILASLSYPELQHNMVSMQLLVDPT